MKWGLVLSLIAVSVCLTGCSTVSVNDEVFTSEAQREPILRTTGKVPFDPEFLYQVGPGDVLELSIGDPTMEGGSGNAEYRVTKTGTIDIPRLDPLPVEGLTVEEIQAEVAERIAAAQRVGVRVSQFRSKRISVVGSVVSPGVYALTEETDTLAEAISLAGGQSEAADTMAFILRTSENLDNPQQLEVDLDELFRTGRSDLDAVLADGETVYIPKSPPRVRLYGEIESPGKLDMPEPFTLDDAIEKAGGLTDSADRTIIRIDRKQAPGKYTGISINLNTTEPERSCSRRVMSSTFQIEGTRTLGARKRTPPLRGGGFGNRCSGRSVSRRDRYRAIPFFISNANKSAIAPPRSSRPWISLRLK